MSFVHGGVVTPQLWIWLAFVFAMGACIGSFLNVVIYRMPRELSLAWPGSACPRCGRAIHFYDNIPLVSWLALRAKCRYCKEPISPRYFVIELLTAMIFVGLFILYFKVGIRQMSIEDVSGLQIFVNGGWLIYLLHVVLLSGLLAVSAIDLELWVVPLSACWFLTAVGIMGAGAAPFAMDFQLLYHFRLVPLSGASSGAVSAGAAIGLGISLLLLKLGVFQQSYLGEETPSAHDVEHHYNHRLEMLRELLFLVPVVAFSAAAYCLLTKVPSLSAWWLNIMGSPVASGLAGALTGYFTGCTIIWATRILGTLVLGKEAMGMGDVHLLGAAGAFIGPALTVVAFFVAPFFGLAWAIFQMFFKKTRQIPYVPFLSLGILTVMIFHDWILQRLAVLMLR
jgi:leader peptidase (prepilin peptidase) / N-methyltransferase